MSRPAGHKGWQVQEAKQRLSELLDKAQRGGPQVVTRHGKEIAVVLSMEDYEALKARRPDFRSFLLSSPSFDELELERSKELPRDVEL